MWRPEREEEQLGREQERELEALDRLLAGGPDPGGEHAGLATLVETVRDDRPSMRPSFAAELEARVAAGFPRRGAGTRRVRRRPATQRWLAGLGAAATLAVGVVVVAGNAGPGGGDQPRIAAPVDRAPAAAAPQTLSAPSGGKASTTASAAPSTAAAGAPSGGRASSSATAPPPAPLLPYRAPGGARAVQRDATLALLAPRGRVQQVSDQAIAATDRLGGIVESSSVSVDDQGGSQASLELRVASAALDRTLAAVSALAHVSSRSQSGLDITDATGAARDRLTEAQAERHALLRQLARATNPNQVASIRAQLGLVAGRIARDQAQLQTLLQRGQFAHVSLNITEDQKAAGGGSGWEPAAALDEALRVLEAVFAVLVVGLAGLVPLVILGGLVRWGLGPVRRRRREGALVRTEVAQP